MTQQSEEVWEVADAVGNMFIAWRSYLDDCSRRVLNDAVTVLTKLGKQIQGDGSSGRTEWDFVRVSRQERAWLIDGLMILMTRIAEIPENDGSELQEMQVLLHRLMGYKPGKDDDSQDA